MTIRFVDSNGQRLDDENGEPLTSATMNQAVLTNVGAYHVHVILSGHETEDEHVPVTVTILPREVHTNFTRGGWTYGDAETPLPQVTFDDGADDWTALVNTEITYSQDATPISNPETYFNAQTTVGTYSMQVTVDSNYELLNNDSCTFTVAKKLLRAEFMNTQGWTYGDNVTTDSLPQVLFIDGMHSLDVAFETVYSGQDGTITTFTSNTPAGEYTLTVTLKATETNYILDTDNTLTFTIAPRTLNIAFTAGGWAYGTTVTLPSPLFATAANAGSSPEAVLAADNLKLNQDYLVKYLVDDTLVEADYFTSKTKIGFYKIEVEIINPNYRGAGSAIFEVARKAVTVTFTNGGWIVGSEVNLPQVTFDGFAADEVASMLATVVYTYRDQDGNLLTAADFTPETPAGTYTLQVALPQNANYKLTGTTSKAIVVRNPAPANTQLTTTDEQQTFPWGVAVGGGLGVTAAVAIIGVLAKRGLARKKLAA